MGATFVNAVSSNVGITTWADFIYDANGTIVGSRGWLQDQLFYITDQLNLTIKTIHIPGPQCEAALVDSVPDVCSMGVAIMAGKPTLFPIPIAIQAQTMVAGIRSGTAPEATVYLDVFGYLQWSTYFSALLALSLGIGVIGALTNAVQQIEQRPSLFEGIVMTSMFLIQQGSHPGARNMASQRVLALTTSILTMLLFIYYANDITAKMTAGSPPIPVRTFEDVLERGYKVIIVSSYHGQLLMNTRRGTAKHSVFKLFIEEDFKKIMAYVRVRHVKSYEQFLAEGGEETPFWYRSPSLVTLTWANEQIINDPKTLLYCSATCVDPIYKDQVIALEMDDMYTGKGPKWMIGQ